MSQAASIQHVALTGASGFLGRALATQLGPIARLRGLFRSPSEYAAQFTAGGHEVVHGDLDDDEALAKLVRGAEVVYHCAARMKKDDRATSHRENVLGTERLAKAAKAAGVRRLVYVSSISVYAATQTADGVLTEEIAPEHIDQLNPYSSTKFLGEEIVRDLAAKGQAPGFTIIRPTNVYGPASPSWFLTWAKQLSRLPVALPSDIPIDVVYIEDVAKALIQAAASSAAEGETLHIGHESIALGEYQVRVGDVIGKRVRRLPAGVDHGVRVFLDAVYPLVKDGRRSMSLIHAKEYPHTKAARLIGYAPQIDLTEGFKRLKHWYDDCRKVQE